MLRQVADKHLLVVWVVAQCRGTTRGASHTNITSIFITIDHGPSALVLQQRQWSENKIHSAILQYKHNQKIESYLLDQSTKMSKWTNTKTMTYRQYVLMGI